MKNLLLITLTFITTNIFADDIWFISPNPGQTQNGMMTIQIQPPFVQKDVRVWIQEEDGWERTVWRGKLSPANNYMINVDTSKFKPGRYNVEAEFYHHFEDYDGDVEIWIGSPQYYQQQAPVQQQQQFTQQQAPVQQQQYYY